MNARGFFKKIVAVTLAGSMVFGSAMVTMADADSEQTNAQGYKPGQVYRGDQNKFDAKGEALPGYHWDYKKLTDYVDGYYDTKQNPICAKTEHEHTAILEHATQRIHATIQNTYIQNPAMHIKIVILKNISTHGVHAIQRY